MKAKVKPHYARGRGHKREVWFSKHREGMTVTRPSNRCVIQRWGSGENGYLSHVRDCRTRGICFSRKRGVLVKKEILIYNQGPITILPELTKGLWGHTNTHSCEGCCGYTAGSNGRWGDAIPDNLACVWRPGRAPEPWKWRHSPLWGAILNAGKKEAF